MALALAVPAGPAAAQGVAGPYLAAKQAELRGDVAAAARLYSQTLARDTGNLAVMERAMMHQIGAGNVAEGVALARRFQAQRPNHHLGVLAIAADALKSDNAAAAREVLADNPPYVGKIMDAWAIFADGQPVEARALLEEIETSDENGAPGKIVAAYHIGLIAAATGDDAGAEEALARAAGMANGGTLRLARLRAGALARLGRTDDAVKVIEERLDGTYGDVGLSTLAGAIRDGQVPEPLVRDAAQGAAEVLFGVSGLLARGRNRLIALAYSRLATHLNPDLTEAQILIAQILEQDQQYDLAIAAYQAVPDDAPEALTALDRPGRGKAGRGPQGRGASPTCARPPSAIRRSCPCIRRWVTCCAGKAASRKPPPPMTRRCRWSARSSRTTGACSISAASRSSAPSSGTGQRPTSAARWNWSPTSPTF